ncbi:GTPase HflX [Macrococcus epidermidis]|uniref:GTPase HflX n=1 Tax=Macrococcus epidermidis TaxID=1902580 RepID=A0A327ZW01_9STAP|nr:GTPase HflX [Macrococcus epidermidis]RAK46590.1 GTPase HflX [Macrococcus epidermidis]
MNDTYINIERALIIAVHLKKESDFDFQASVSEIKSLCETAGLEVVNTVIQNKDRPDHSFYLGKGKIEEIIELKERVDLEFDVVVVNDELTNSQSKRLNEMLDCKIIDRTQVILDIFAQRAKSREGKLQVELAQLEYLLPRLSGHGQSLSRLGGGIGTRGPGETKLEMNRRHIRNKIHDIKTQLEVIKEHRKRYRENRQKKQMFQVALVGYTNAGKSTWFNKLTESNTFMEDKLFATLDPKSKIMKVNDGFNILLSDTVGFIQQLPTHLVEAFSSTLEEAKYADVIVHVVDRSHPDYMNHIKTVENILAELDMKNIPMLTLYNKKDLLEMSVDTTGPHQLVVSVNDPEDVSRFKAALVNLIKTEMQSYHIKMLDYDGQTISTLKETTLVENLEFNEMSQLYEIKGYENPENGVTEQLMNHKAVETIFTETEGKNEDN